MPPTQSASPRSAASVAASNSTSEPNIRSANHAVSVSIRPSRRRLPKSNNNNHNKWIRLILFATIPGAMYFVILFDRLDLRSTQSMQQVVDDMDATFWAPRPEMREPIKASNKREVKDRKQREEKEKSQRKSKQEEEKQEETRKKSKEKKQKQEDGKASVSKSTKKEKAKKSKTLRDKIISERLLEGHNVSWVDLGKPPLEALIDEDLRITGDVGFLLDFAIIGFGKCGTSTMMHWLAGHPEIQSFVDEVWDLMWGKPGKLVARLYYDLPAGEEYKRGYKAPADITQEHVHEYLRKYFPKARLFVGIRHPVRWFESLYNFRVQNLDLENQPPMPETYKLIGTCWKGARNTCTDNGNFGYSLLKLGKQNHDRSVLREPTEVEKLIVNKRKKGAFNISAVEPLPHPLFFFELAQFSDENETRAAIFRKDVQNFLGLKNPLPPLPHHKPGKKQADEHQKILDQHKINICDDEHKAVREVLQGLAMETSQWIRESFLDFPGVYVSSRPYLESILEEWKTDPCDRKDASVEKI